MVRGILIIIVLVLVFVVYPLSAGPAAWIVECTGSERLRMVGTAVYFPLVLLAEQNDTLISMLDSYMEWWIA